MGSLCYADVAVLIAENEDDLQRLLIQFYKTAKRFNVTILTAKIKWVTTSKTPIRCKLYMNNNIFQNK